MFNTILFNSGLFNQIPIAGESESALLSLSSESGQYSIIDELQHSDILPMDVYSGSSAVITYIQHSTTLSLDAYAGEIGKVIDFKTDPRFYYPDANNDFTFFCEYNAPAGEVDFIFPDTPCASFDYFEAYSGEATKFLELFAADWLPFAYSGEGLDLTLLTFELIPLNAASTGESVSLSTILISKLLDLIGYSGEYGLFNSLYVPPRAELSIDGYADGNTQLDLSASYGLSFNAYGDECGLAVLSPTDYGSYILTEGPVAYWKFDEQTGTSATDSTGNNSAATINGPTLANASPVASKFAFYFDGTNDLVTGNPTSVVSANLTQELWVKPDAGATITLYTPSSSGVQGNSGQRYAVYPRQGGTGSGGGISVGSNGIQVIASGNSYFPVLLSYQQPISTTQYTHILVSWNDRTPTLYVNGVAVATGYQARSQFNSQGLPSNGAYGYYKGYMQDVAIYTSALTANQAREHYLAGIGLHYIPRFEPLPSYSGEYADADFTIDTTPVGYILNFSGENAIVDDLRTVSLFDATAVSGESGEWLLATYPSVDLGIVTNPTGENTYAVLLTSSIIEISNYSGEVSAFSVSFFPSAGLGILPGYAGEREYLDLITYAIFRDIDAREGQSANADLTTSPPVLLDPRAYGDENTLFDLSVELAIDVTGRSGENALFLFDTHPSINLGIVASYTGQRAESLALVTSSVLSLPFYAGENNLLSFTTFPGLEVTLQFIEGETNLVSLATVSLLDGKAYHGQYGTSTLTTFIGSTFTPIFYPGTTADVSLRTIDRLNPIAYSGNNINVTLTDYSAIPLSLSVYSGENVNVAILPGITFPSIAYSGINATLDLYFIVNQGMPAGWYDGESVELSIASTDALPFVGYSGENALLYFGASFALYPTAYSGIYAQASLTLNPFDQIDGAGYNGQIVYTTLNTTSRLPNIGYSGETILFDLHQNLQPNILLVAYDGETLIANLQISFQLPIGRCYSGNIVVVNQIDSEPNIHFYSDSMFGAVISTTDVFKMSEISSGQNCFLGLSVGKSEGIGFLGVYSGTTSLTSFDTVHHASLYVMFRTSIMTQVDIGSATYFDLNTDACCGVRRETTSNNLLMHLFVKDYLPEAISDGDRVVFSLDLRCNPRFSFECRTGSTFEFNEYDGYLAMNFANGTECILNQFDADLTNRLCKGYFVPNGNWLVVEMNDVLPEECYADLFYSGTAMSCILSDDIVIRVNNFYNGEHLSPSLTTFPPWLFIFHTGERLWCEFSVVFSIYPIARTGENLQFRFYEEPFICYTGASGECEITVDYKVRFKETGCLDNDFTYQNEDGDLIPELSNPIPVEGEPFYHSVLAECY